MSYKIELQVNGETYCREIKGNTRLIDLLREELGLMGTKEGCSEGVCGACTVIMDGLAVNACMVMAFQAQNSKIITVEGLAKYQQDRENLNNDPAAIDNLDPIQEAFIAKGAVQCGFCTPGMIMSTKALLDYNPDPSPEDARKAISGNLCRCTGYEKIVEAVFYAAQLLQRGEG